MRGGDDVVCVQTRGEGALRVGRGLMGNRKMPEDETLHGGHLGGQSDAHGTHLMQCECRSALVIEGSRDGRLDGGYGHNQH